MKKLDKNTKLTIQLIIAVVVIIAGLTLLYMAFFAPPKGEIHESILIAYGESLTFAGALIGIDYAAKTAVQKVRESISSPKEESELDGSAE